MKNPKKTAQIKAFLARQKGDAKEDGKNPAAHERAEKRGKKKQDPS